MFDEFHQNLTYKRFVGLTPSDTALYDSEVTVKGLRVKGQIKVVHSEDGDTTTCTICYRTQQQLVPKSLLEGREIMESVPINALGLDTGYLNYVK